MKENLLFGEVSRIHEHVRLIELDFLLFFSWLREVRVAEGTYLIFFCALGWKGVGVAGVDFSGVSLTLSSVIALLCVIISDGLNTYLYKVRSREYLRMLPLPVVLLVSFIIYYLLFKYNLYN